MHNDDHKGYNLKSNILLVLGFSALLPFLLLSSFNHPSADDFCNSTSVTAVGFLRTQVQIYGEWSGLYFANALQSIPPFVFTSPAGYKIVPLLVIVLLFFSLFSFIREITSRTFTARENLLMSLALFALFLYGMPSVPEGLYWYTSVSSYQMGSIFTLLFLVVMLRFYDREYAGRRGIHFTLAASLIIAIAGLNLIGMFLLILIVLSLFVIRTARTKTIDWPLSALLIVAGIASSVVIIAPGFAARSATSLSPYKHQFLFALFSSAKLLGENVYYWVTHTPLLLLTLLYLPVGAALTNEQRTLRHNFSLHPVIALALSGVFLVALFFPYTWATGEDNPPGRIANVAYLFFLVGWFLNVQGCINFFRARLNIRIQKLPAYAQGMALTLLFMSLLNPNNIIAAYEDILKGIAYGYDEELNARYKALGECNTGVCDVKKLEHRPGAIFFADITEDEKDWHNTCYAGYFHKKAVRISAAAMSEGTGRCERSPTLPLDMSIPVEVNYGKRIKLWGVTTSMPSENRLRVSLYWQRLENLGSFTTVFVHFTDTESKIVLWKHHDFCQRLLFEESRGKFIKETLEVSIPDSVKGKEVFMKVGIITQEPIPLNRLRIESAGQTPTDDNSTRATLHKLIL